MRKRVILMVAAAFLAAVVVPVLVAQAAPHKGRTLKGVQLSDTSYEEVKFTNREQHIDLAGMLFLPEGEGPFPGVVMIHGASTSRRDNSWYLTFADYLQKNGIAVLLPDKRGSESSGGDWHTASFPDLATDTIAAVTFLREHYADKISKVGAFGLSQGGQVVPIAATECKDIAFAINVVGSAVPFYKALLFEENKNLRQMGFVPGVSNGIARLSTLYIRKVKQKEFWDKIGNYDPIPYWSKVTVPSLVLLGGADTNTPAVRSAERLNALHKPNLRVIVYEGSGHPLEDPVGRGDNIVRHEVLTEIRDFIVDAVK